MIDTKTFELAKPSHAVYLEAQTKIDIKKDEHLKLSEEDFLICHYKMAGLALSNKRWCFFEIDNIKEIQYNPGAFETLVLPQEQKETILSLVRVHADKRLAFDDIIKGKGKGMIFLLHGVPGVGKTLTAGRPTLFCCFINYSSYLYYRERRGLHSKASLCRKLR